MKKVQQVEKIFMRKKVAQFRAGDTLRVHIKIKEGEKERIQVFQGTVIGRRGSGIGATFTVRKVSGGIGVERIFPVHSPNIEKIERIKVGSVRRAKLNYLRKLTGKSARIREQVVEGGQTEVQSVEDVVQQETAEDAAAEDTIVEGQPDVKAAEKTETAEATKE